jgi:hypothetical protein
VQKSCQAPSSQIASIDAVFLLHMYFPRRVKMEIQTKINSNSVDASRRGNLLIADILLTKYLQ